MTDSPNSTNPSAGVPVSGPAMEQQLKDIIFGLESDVRDAFHGVMVLALALERVESEKECEALQYVAYHAMDKLKTIQKQLYPNGGLPWGRRT